MKEIGPMEIRFMQVIYRQMLNWKNLLRCAGVMALFIMLISLQGCATGSRLAEQVPADSVPAVPEGLGVTHYEDGREGFVIREAPAMDAESRNAFEKALALMQTEDFGAAAELLQKVIESSPGVTAPYINMAIACRQTGKTKEAEESLKKALELVPQHPVASNEYGLLLRHEGRFAEARTIYEQSLAAFPEYLPLHRNLGILCDLYLNDQVCALEQYQIYSDAMPEDEKVKIWIADLQMRSGLQ